MITAPTKQKYPRAGAIRAAKELCQSLSQWCERLAVAGSLRRRKSEVGDIEILYISKLERIEELRQADLLAPSTIKHLVLADCQINAMAGFYLQDGAKVRREPFLIFQRKNIQGSITWGEKNKYARHIATGIPVDFFRATEETWFNYLVCRTGGAETNVRIAAAAQAKGWKWHPYGSGFTDAEGTLIPVTSEQDVFRLAGLPYLEPWQR